MQGNESEESIDSSEKSNADEQKKINNSLYACNDTSAGEEGSLEDPNIGSDDEVSADFEDSGPSPKIDMCATKTMKKTGI